MAQQSLHSGPGARTGDMAVDDLPAHERTYGGFTIGTTGVAVHVAILLSSLALAFLGNAPVMAMMWFVVAHIGLIVMLVRLAHTRRDVVHASVPKRH